MSHSAAFEIMIDVAGTMSLNECMNFSINVNRLPRKLINFKGHIWSIVNKKRVLLRTNQVVDRRIDVIENNTSSIRGLKVK